jgi:hypothetical protein
MQDEPTPKLVATSDDSFAIVDPDGKTSVTILTPMKDADDPYRIRYFRSSQEIYDATGKTVARTTDRAMAEHIRSLLIVWVRMKEKQAGTSPAN